MKMNIHRLLSLLLALSLVLGCFAGCGAAEKAPAATTAPATEAPARTVVDMSGRIVELPETVNSVFCDWASGVTLIMTLGATEKLAVAHSAFDSDSFAWARLVCPAINDVPKNDDPYTNAEAALALGADLVVTNNPDNVDIYENLGMTVVFVNYSDNVSFQDSMRIVGEALGEKEAEQAKRYNTCFEENVRFVSDRLAHVDAGEKPSVYYMDSRFGDAYHTVGTGEIQEEWINAAGANLATAAEFEGRNLEITAEKILTLDPDYIMIGAQNQADVYDLLMEDPLLSGLSAVKQSNVVRIPQGIFPWCRTGPEAAIQMIWAAKLLYPAEFEDVDISIVAKDFYRNFYGTEVDDDTIAGILAGKLTPSAR